MANDAPARDAGLVTLAIPTMDRSSFLTALLSHVERSCNHPEIKVVVLDGSSKPEEREANIAACERVGAEYQWYDPSIYTFYMRLDAGLRTITTPYTMPLGDDDVFNEDTVIRCVEFLERKPDFTACTGEYAQFKRHENGSVTLITRPQVAVAAYEHDHIVERWFWALIELPNSIFYAVHRTADFQSTASRAVRGLSNKGMDFRIADPLIFSLIVAHGKIGNIAEPLLLRRAGSSVPREEHLLGDELFLEGTEFFTRYNRARAELVKFLPAMPEQAANDIVDAIWSMFAGYCLSPRRISGRLTRALKVANLPAISLPKPNNVRFDYESYPPKNEQAIRYDFGLSHLHRVEGMSKVRVVEARDSVWWAGIPDRFGANAPFLDTTIKQPSVAPAQPLMERLLGKLNRHILRFR